MSPDAAAGISSPPSTRQRRRGRLMPAQAAIGQGPALIHLRRGRPHQKQGAASRGGVPAGRPTTRSSLLALEPSPSQVAFAERSGLPKTGVRRNHSPPAADMDQVGTRSAGARPQKKRRRACRRFATRQNTEVERRVHRRPPAGRFHATRAARGTAIRGHRCNRLIRPFLANPSGL